MRTWNETQDGEEDVDEQVGAAATLEEDTERRQDDGQEDLDDVAVTAISFCRPIADGRFFGGVCRTLPNEAGNAP